LANADYRLKIALTNPIFTGYFNLRIASCNRACDKFLEYAFFQAVLVDDSFPYIGQIYHILPAGLLFLITLKDSMMKFQIH